MPVETLRADIAATAAAIAGLHDDVSRTALASYSCPDDTDLRFAADMALANLRDASDRLQQLKAALSQAERQEQEAMEQQRLVGPGCL